jgi:hypothetical protein
MKTGGRQKGTPNRVTASAREAIILAFDNIGGVATLTVWAEANEGCYVWSKVLPLQLSSDPENPLITHIPKESS